MFDRLTKAYLWIMLCMAFTVGTVSVEAHKRDAAINKATQEALVKGLWSGCAELTNPTREQVQAVISELEALHSGERGTPPYGDPYWTYLRDLARPVNCDDYAKNRSYFYTGP